MGDLPDPTRTLYFFSLIIVKSLQLRERRQIVEPRKYCLVRVIVLFFLRVFSLYFCFSQVGNFGFIPYKQHKKKILEEIRSSLSIIQATIHKDLGEMVARDQGFAKMCPHVNPKHL